MSSRPRRKIRRSRGDVRSVVVRSIAVFLLLLTVPTHAFAVDSALVRSLLIPGLGQAHQGHYTKAAILAGSAILSGFGLFLSHIHYNEAVDKYNDQKKIYASYQEDIARGNVVRFEDMTATYAQMEAEHNSAEDRLVWRSAFFAAFVATYAVNIVDVLISKPHQIDSGERLSVDVDANRVLVTKTFRF